MRLGEYAPPPTDAAGIRDQQDAPAEPSADDDRCPPGSRGELDALRALGFSKPFLTRHAERARAHGTAVESELLACGDVEEEAYYGAIARLLRLPFRTVIDPDQLSDIAALDSQLVRPTLLRIAHRHKAPEIAIVPEARRVADLAAVLATLPMLGRDLVVTTPTALRRAVWAAGAAGRAKAAANSLFERTPWLSARVVLTGRQGFYGGLALATLLAGMMISPIDVLLWLHIGLSLVYLTALSLRIYALIRRSWRLRRAERHGLLGLGSAMLARFARPGRSASPHPAGPATGRWGDPPALQSLPRYSVLVALYREAPIAEQLVTSLSRLDWPASLLDIKLICEAHDVETIEALKAARPGPQFEIVAVPDIGPRTKPKALNYALAAASGEFLAIYDAEDRPHPQQLREAYARFRAAPDNLACLQAPLIIANADDGWLSALFSLEYAGLFRGLLPMLGRAGMPMPLGGTSNHFRAEALRKAGGWDPFNVTEDADMGLRLYRLGYTADVIHRQTMEDAPTDIPVWIAQRTRWYKGWLQTWLVLMRNPRRLVLDIGIRPFAVFQLLVGGMLASALLHPLIISFLLVSLAPMLNSPQTVPLPTLLLFSVDTANILGSYLIFLGLGLGSMIDYEKRKVGWQWIMVPAYWMMTSFAAWRAVIELKTKPFHWNKTPHRPMKPGR